MRYHNKGLGPGFWVVSNAGFGGPRGHVRALLPADAPSRKRVGAGLCGRRPAGARGAGRGVAGRGAAWGVGPWGTRKVGQQGSQLDGF